MGNSQKQQFRNKCIFCNSDNTSREHIFPQWLRARINGPCHKPYDRNTFRRQADSSYKYSSFAKNTQNSVLGVTTKRVCTKCNNGWLSQLETRVIPIYFSLTEEPSVTLPEDKQLTISTWASILAIKWDLTDTATSAHTEEDRKFIYRNLCPPPNFRVWIGYCDDVGIEVRHRTACMRKLEDQYRLPHTPNTRSTSMMIGKLVIHVLSHEPDSFDIIRDANIRNHKLEQIWPTVQNFKLNKEKTTKSTQIDIKLYSHCCGMQHEPHFVNTIPGL